MDDTELQKSYVPSVAGQINNVPAQAASWFEPDPSARRDFVVPAPSPVQPNELTGNADGSAVQSGPSASGTGMMTPGSGSPS